MTNTASEQKQRGHDDGSSIPVSRGRFAWGVMRCGLLMFSLMEIACADDTPIALVPSVDSATIMAYDYGVIVSGSMQTPAAGVQQNWELNSVGNFQFRQRQLTSELPLPHGIRAVRRFGVAETKTTVGSSHKTNVSLPPAQRIVRIYGSDDGLRCVAAGSWLARKQIDLLQMPGDPLVAAGLLPRLPVKIKEKWNTEAWVLPALAGIEAVIKQSLTCTLDSSDGQTALITFSGQADGASNGSATVVEIDGQLTFDVKHASITRFRLNQNEKRSVGPVSPGLKVSVVAHWTSSVTDDSSGLPESLPDDPTADELQLTLQSPWKLRALHSREWHLFHETANVMMLRMMRNGGLIAQCNISQGVAVAPGEHTSDMEFLRDVQSAVAGRGGAILAEDTFRDDSAWRIRHIRAAGKTNEQTVIWDYYLCSASTGDQFSIVFSHADTDSAAFDGQARRILGTLSLASVRPRAALPFR